MKTSVTNYNAHTKSRRHRATEPSRETNSIGAGSSGVQVVPALVDKVKLMDHYVRSKTWVSPQLARMS